MKNKNQATQLKQEVLIKVIAAFFSENFENAVNRIPLEMRPKGAGVPYRCCIHKERAILRARTIAALGGSLREDDEVKALSEYARDAIKRVNLPRKALTIIDTACHGCVPARIFVTDLCQGCVARQCIGSCNFKAIFIQNGRAVIDQEKCKNCGMCVKACPYYAIVKRVVPCEQSCPVAAIKKNDLGFAEIDFDKCINCGACISACPFGAVTEKSQIIDILKAIKSNKDVVAMLAPSIAGQLPYSIKKIASALIKAGFSAVYEVAQGADLTAQHEAKDFSRRINRGDSFVTTSCCAAYKELLNKHMPELTPFVSETPSPMAYTAEIAKQDNKDCTTVFIGPCVAKRTEGLRNKDVDFVMSYEEINVLFKVLGIDSSLCEDYIFTASPSLEAKKFGISGGVIDSVKTHHNKPEEIKPVYIDGFNEQSIKNLRTYANNKKCPLGNLIEVMACPGGCVGGSSTVEDPKRAACRIKKLNH